MKEDDKIEDLFRDKLKNFEAEVSSNVWENVQTALKGFGLGFLVKGLINRVGTSTLIAVVSSAAAILGTVLVMNWAGNKKEEIVKNKPAVTQAIIEKTSSVTTPNVIPKEEVKPHVIISEKVVIPKKENNASIPKNNKQEIAKLINTLSEEHAASIYASPVSGTVPLIVNLINNGTGKINKWSYGDSKKTEVAVNPLHIYEIPGVYTVMLSSTNTDGKTSMDSVKIEVTGNSIMESASTTKTFSPDGDGDADSLTFNTQNIVKMNGTIYDMKNNIVYEWNGVNVKWDGKNLNGKDANEGRYIYIINAEGGDGKKYAPKGIIRLTRKKLSKH